MIEKPRDLPAGKCRTQKQERHPSPELPRVLHELMNQLTIMNFSCAKFRAAAAHLTDHSIAIDIDKMEKTIVDMTALVEKRFSSDEIDVLAVSMRRSIKRKG